MHVNDPTAKDKRDKSPKPEESTGKVYERLVEDLFMGDSSDEEKSEETDDAGIRDT